MNFDKLIKILFGENINEINELLLSSKLVTCLSRPPSLLIHTGFRTNPDLFRYYDIELLYDADNEILLHQILNKNRDYFSRHIGLHMYLSQNGFYSPIVSDELNPKTIKLKYFNCYHENRFSHLKEISCNIVGLTPNFDNEDELADLDILLNFGSFNCSNLSAIEKILNNRFKISFELGNEIITLCELPLSFFYRYNTWNKDDLVNFYNAGEMLKTPRTFTPSYRQMGEEELKSWDNDFPGWGDGVLD